MHLFWNSDFCISNGKDPPPAPIKTNLAYTSQRSPLFFVPESDTPGITLEILYPAEEINGKSIFRPEQFGLLVNRRD